MWAFAARMLGAKAFDVIKNRIPWKGISAAVAVALLAVWIGSLYHDRNEARLQRDNWKTAHETLKADVAKATAEARAADAQHALKIERARAAATQETSRAYQSRISDLRASYQRLLAAAAADSRGGRAAAVPALPGAAGRSDGAAPHDGDAALALADAQMKADMNALQVIALQDWIKAQQGVEQ